MENAITLHDDLMSSIKHVAVFDCFMRSYGEWWQPAKSLSIAEITKIIRPFFASYSGLSSKGLWWECKKIFTYGSGSYGNTEFTRLTPLEFAEVLHEIINYSPGPKPAPMQVPSPGTQLTLF